MENIFLKSSRRFLKAKVRVLEMQKHLFWLFLQNIFFFPLIFFFFVFFPSLVPHILGITDTCFHLGVCFTSSLLIMSRIKKYIIRMAGHISLLCFVNHDCVLLLWNKHLCSIKCSLFRAKLLNLWDFFQLVFCCT